MITNICLRQCCTTATLERTNSQQPEADGVIALQAFYTATVTLFLVGLHSTVLVVVLCRDKSLLLRVFVKE